MEQQTFEFEFDDGPKVNNTLTQHQQQRTCAICGRRFLYTEYLKITGHTADGGFITEQDREKNAANPSWMNYCCRKHFVKGAYNELGRKGVADPIFIYYMKVNDITLAELTEAMAE